MTVCAPPPSRLAQEIRKRRRDAGLTQAALGESLGVDQTAVSQWELGKARPAVETLERIATFFRCSIDELIRG